MILKIKAITWDKQNYELFDTESNQYKVQLFQFRKEGFLYRDNFTNETYISEKMAEIKAYLQNPQYKIIMVVARMGQILTVGSPKVMKVTPEDDLWCQARKDQILKESDIVKLGKK